MPLLALQIKEILVEESNVQPVNSPVTVSWLAPAQGGHISPNTAWPLPGPAQVHTFCLVLQVCP